MPCDTEPESRPGVRALFTSSVVSRSATTSTGFKPNASLNGRARNKIYGGWRRLVRRNTHRGRLILVYMVGADLNVTMVYLNVTMQNARKPRKKSRRPSLRLLRRQPNRGGAPLNVHPLRPRQASHNRGRLQPRLHSVAGSIC